jgi:hypothetical protein
MTPGSLEPLVETLERGGVVAIATESFFGLLADAARPDAVERLSSLRAVRPRLRMRFGLEGFRWRSARRPRSTRASFCMGASRCGCPERARLPIWCGLSAAR